jgi:hypothetical protein
MRLLGLIADYLAPPFDGDFATPPAGAGMHVCVDAVDGFGCIGQRELFAVSASGSESFNAAESVRHVGC